TINYVANFFVSFEDILQIFHLTSAVPTEHELSPSKAEMVSPLPHVDSILTDDSTATKGSPENEAVVRSRIVAIILTTLAKMKQEYMTKPKPIPRVSITSSSSVMSGSSIASIESINSIHLQSSRISNSLDSRWRNGAIVGSRGLFPLVRHAQRLFDEYGY
ncbi:hypothetical protein N7519_002524, partial [Penicillium mononematosum]|uniref:uncharacterized protein n=1 Tax=Penicillium mononematosum TaxID=268346 RepID=UPI0025477AAC